MAVGQGKVEGGLSTNVYDDGYGWTGAGAPGDSGSGVLTAPGGPAIGDFTHLIVDLGAYPGSDLAGTRITKILQPVRRLARQRGRLDDGRRRHQLRQRAEVTLRSRSSIVTGWRGSGRAPRG